MVARVEALFARARPRSPAPADPPPIRFERHGDGTLVRGVDMTRVTSAIWLAEREFQRFMRREAFKPARAGRAKAAQAARSTKAMLRREILKPEVERLATAGYSDSAIAKILTDRQERSRPEVGEGYRWKVGRHLVRSIRQGLGISEADRRRARAGP